MGGSTVAVLGNCYLVSYACACMVSIISLIMILSLALESR